MTVFMSEKNNCKAVAIILAAGVGKRMCSDQTKQTMLLCGRTVIFRTVASFYESHEIDSMVIVGREVELDFLRVELAPFADKIHAIVAGGDTRAQSAKIGFENIPENTEIVAIHDGARCLITQRVIKSVIEKARETSAAFAASPVYDTVKLVDKDGAVVETPKREALLRAETPQAFSVEVYSRALAAADGLSVTDDNMLVENIGVKVYAVICEDDNFKITTRTDLRLAEIILEERGEYV